MQKYYRDHDLNKERARARRARADPEQMAARLRAKRQRRKSAIKTYNDRYKAENRALYASCARARYSRKIQAMPRWQARGPIDAIYERAQKLRESTGVPYEVDHIVPLQGKAVCGLHVPWNLRIITKSENVSKSNKLIEELL